jgi:hypothetical protein
LNAKQNFTTTIIACPYFSTGPRQRYGLAASRRTARDAELMMMMKDLDCRTSLEREKRV